MSKHGGSPQSGLVPPVGVELALAPDGSAILVPPEVLEARKQAAERQERAVQLERRRIGLTLLAEQVAWQGVPDDAAIAHEVKVALKLADELMKQTGGGI